MKAEDLEQAVIREREREEFERREPRCKRCGGAIDRARIRTELRERTSEIPETCRRAAEAAVFCGLDCALADLVSHRSRFRASLAWALGAWNRTLAKLAKDGRA